MNRRTQGRSGSKAVALCGLLAAASLVIMLMGSMIPLALFACPILAMILSIPAVEQLGTKYALCLYAATAILTLLLAADKELAFFYLFLGYYPAVRKKLDALPRPAPILLKLLIFNSSMAVMYWLLISVFRLSAVVAELKSTGILLLFVTLVLGNVTFILLDLILKRMTGIFRRKIMRKFK